jgi:hypothetical protein
MTEQTMPHEGASKSTMATIIRQVIKYAVLALILLTCIMAAYRKFGG